MYSRNKDALDLQIQKIEGVINSLFAAQVIAAPLKLGGAITLISAARRHSPFPGA